MLASCADTREVADRPRLIAQNTLVPATMVSASAATSGVTTIAEATLVQPPTAEIQSPLEMVTVEAEFLLVTPTLPPSKTPTTTPTLTPTPTVTISPTLPATATAMRLLLPTSVIASVTAPVPVAVNQVCDSTWFFIQPRPDNCPLNPPSASQGVYQTFQNGYMVWVGSQDAIYVLYTDRLFPRWQVFRDFFEEGMVEDSPEYANAPGPGLWQPRRGFGMLWRSNTAVRQRIGWGTIEWEQPFSVQVQTASDGVIFLSRPDGVIFSLFPQGNQWQEFSSTGMISIEGPVNTSGAYGGLPPIYPTNLP